MSGSLISLRSRYEHIAIPTIWVAFALSLLLHAALLAGWRPKVSMLPFDATGQGKPSGSLAVRLAPPPPAPAILAQPSAPARRAPAPRAAPSAPSAPPSAPPVLALERPSPAAAPRPPAGDDLASFIEARRRAREPAAAAPPSQASPPAETEQERHNRLAAANLGLNRTPSFGTEQKRGGGIFQIQRMGVDSAEFVFFGWNKYINRNSQQTIEVRRGDNPSIELAVVRRMIAIIREHERGDFVWESRRLGRDVWLSARMSDNAGLEDFVMSEFFPHLRAVN